MIFLLECLSDPTLQQDIRGETTKIESRQWPLITARCVSSTTRPLLRLRLGDSPGVLYFIVGYGIVGQERAGQRPRLDEQTGLRWG
jgi:hypothetical protein